MAGISQSPYNVGVSPFTSHVPPQLWQLQAALQQLLQVGYVQQQQLQQLQQLVPLQLQQIQQLIQLVAQQQTYPTPHVHPYGLPTSFATPSIGPGWLAATQSMQPQLFAGQAGYVM
jgi:hypothetical protein